MSINPGRRCWLSGLMVLLPGVVALAADFPPRPVTMLVPYAAGGGADVLARLCAEKLVLKDSEFAAKLEAAGL